jgi:hypothetical protein
MTWVVGAVSLVVVGVTGGASSAATLPTNARESFRADARLLEHIPDRVGQTCLLGDTVANSAPGDHYVASLECHPDPETTITYRQHRTLTAMTNQFQRFARNADELVLDDEDAGCESLEPYEIEKKAVGSSLCEYDDSTGAVSITWTYEPLAVIAILERDDGDAAAARATWRDEAGPDHVVRTLPRVLSRRNARASATELLAQIPDADANGCVATDLSTERSLVRSSSPSGMVGSPALWLDAEVVCKGEYPDTATYRRYRNDAAYAAAYDSTNFLEFSESDDPTCPDGYESSWSVDDTEVGRIACYYLGVAGEGEAHLRWTYDPDRIVAEAYALREPSAQDLYDWWGTRAGPQT